ncbi:methyltransferase-like protein 22 isoform X2 [Phoenix dactylifera]|uniref:Methyltransferase-like protein 22 isoform X2 n=1 Tax=Phoenix dactylifera TaxID=42345 RepID=A0A8B7CBS7_PHODC|nr:methyltransferase-like protein 22 isoform X2 [Phoenix dactylifera]
MEGEKEEEQVMSEVHLGCPPGFSGSYVSHFTFPLPSTNMPDERYDDNDRLKLEVASSQEIILDDDGDLLLTRRNDKNRRYLNYGFIIRHNITSSLGNVGLQVWRAAMVLTDFVLHKSLTSSDFNDIIALELGLVGIALARVARTVFITDRGMEVLGNCAANVELNSDLLKFREPSIYIRELDWKETWPPNLQTCDFSSQPRTRYSWASSEIQEAERATLLLAADVIYSDELTDSFFSILERLMAWGSEKVLYLALEKRYNFSLEELDVVANGYAHFRSLLKDGEEYGGHGDTMLPRFVGELINLGQIPQYIREYERGKDLEIWKITYCSTRLK